MLPVSLNLLMPDHMYFTKPGAWFGQATHSDPLLFPIISLEKRFFNVIVSNGYLHI